ncbi:MAG TPA: DinB family protein [Dehalococcoidia bacterium]|nr:DinB family protein [Dehalococcoidia bacterium]
MVQRVESGTRRWLIKAVREAAGELFQQFSGVNESGLRWRPADDEWCLKEIAAHMRDAEQLYQSQLDLIAHRRNPRLPHEPIDVLPFERDYRNEKLKNLLWEWEASREETVWILYQLDEDDWLRTGNHPYRGEVSIYQIARELHEHDLEHLVQARRLREQALEH